MNSRHIVGKDRIKGFSGKALIALFLLVLLSSAMNFERSEGHISPSQFKQVGDYLIYFDFKPLYPIPGKETTLSFRILGVYGREVEPVNVAARVSSEGTMIYEFPKQGHLAKNFTFNYVFPYEAIYTVSVVIITNEGELTSDFKIAAHSEFLAFVEEYGIAVIYTIVGGVLVMIIYWVHNVFK